MKFQNAYFKNKSSLRKLKRKLNFVALFSLSFFLLGGIFDLKNTARAQGGKTEIEKQINPPIKKNVTSPVIKKTNKENSQHKPKTKPVGTKVKTTSAPVLPIKVEERQPITIKTGATAVEIWSDGKLIGTSDPTGKLQTSLTSGEHLITARKYNQDLVVSKNIVVSSEQNNLVDLSDRIAKGIDEIQNAQKNNGTDTKDSLKPIDSDVVLKNYQDPQLTQSVTVDDWQAVYTQCRQEVAIGNTDNKIEAICSFAQGQIELSLGNRPKAINLFSAAILFLPNSPILHYGLGVAQLSAGNKGEATSSFVKTIQLDNKFALAYKELGKIYQAQDRTKEAASYYQQAQTLGGSTPELRLNIAETQIKNGNCGAAVKELEALQTESPSANGLMALSNCYIEQKRAVSAIEALNKAIELDPTSALAQYRIGVIYLKQKEFSKAKEALERALALDAEGKTVNRKELQGLIGKAQKRASN